MPLIGAQNGIKRRAVSQPLGRMLLFECSHVLRRFLSPAGRCEEKGIDDIWFNKRASLYNYYYYYYYYYLIIIFNF